MWGEEVRDLEAALGRLADLTATEAPDPSEGPYATPFDKLRGALVALDRHETTDRIRPDRLSEARWDWEASLKSGPPISRSAALTLCWDPEVAARPDFCAALERVASPLRGRAIRGLMTSYHQAWPEKTPDLGNLIRRTLESLERSRGVVDQWRRITPQIVGTSAPARFSEECFRDDTSASKRLAEVGLATSTPFARDVATALANRYSNAPIGSQQLSDFVSRVLPEDNDLLVPKVWGKIYAELVSTTQNASNSQLRQSIIDLALKTRVLPDPRMDVDAWVSIPKTARQTVMRWLSEEDLRFFFDLLMQGQRDPQGRYRFWIQYASSALRSRVVVGAKDMKRRRRELNELLERGRSFATMTGAGGSNAHASAFIMDFGKATIVEFSQPNSACYIYPNDSDNPYLDLSSPEFSWKQLKNTSRADYYSHIHDWQSKFKGILAQHGIRPARR